MILMGFAFGIIFPLGMVLGVWNLPYSLSHGQEDIYLSINTYILPSCPVLSMFL